MNRTDFDTPNISDDLGFNISHEKEDPIFKLKSLSLQIIYNDILGIGVSNKFLLISNKKNEVFRWIFDKDTSIRNTYSIPLPEKERGASTKFFCDQSGNHTIFKHNRYFFYFNIQSEKIKLLTKFSDINIESVAFDESASEQSTNTILIGSDKGKIYGYQIDYDVKNDKITEKITEFIKLKNDSAIQGIAYETYKDKNLSYVIVVTDCQLYQFMGSSNLEQLFNKYKLHEGTSKYLDGPCKTFPSGELTRSSLQMFFKKDGSFQSFGWMTAAGFCYGNYVNEIIDKLINSFIVVPYVKIKREGGLEVDDNPIAVCHSEYHIYFLYSDCITIISKITSNIVHTEYLYDISSNIIGMYYDKSKSCLFLYSSKSIFQLQIERENRDVWKAYLEKEDYENALSHCKQNNLLTQIKKVSKLYGNSLFEQGDYANAAIKYSESDERFEEVALKFLVKNKYEALKLYLTLIDKNLPEKTSHTQKTLLATWLTEIYLHELNSITNSVQYKNLRDRFQMFMKEKNDYLDAQTIYQLLHHYGRIQEFLDFAEMKYDYETVILHYVNEKQYDKAIEKLHNFMKFDKNKKEGSENVLSNIFSKYSHIFMKYQPELTIDKLLRSYRHIIDSNRIISAIMNTDDSKKDKVADFLEDLIKNKVKDKNIHNLYIFFLAQLNTESSIKKLLKYLDNAIDKQKHDFEADYAIKIFSQFKIPSAQALALAIMSKYDEGVEIALDSNYTEIAKKIANNVTDMKKRKDLWLKIFEHEMKENLKNKSNDNFNYAIDLMKESEVLKIEDILPKLMDNIRIESFKQEITKCIDTYENSIELLKDKIIKYNKTADVVKNDISKVKKKHMEIKYQQCICEVCNNLIKEDNIFMFPCGHLFDSNCIFNQIKQYSSILINLQPKVEALLITKNEVENLEKRKVQSNISDNMKEERGTFFPFKGFGSDSKRMSNSAKRILISSEELKTLDEKRKQYNDLLSEECVLCGDMMIESVTKPFVSANNKDSWSFI